MDKSNIKKFHLTDVFKCLLKWIRRSLFIIIAAIMLGFSNAFNDELRWINDNRNFDEQEEVINDDNNKD